MSESGGVRVLEEQTAGFQHDVQDLQGEPQHEQPGVTEVQGKLQKDSDPPVCPRQTERARVPTEKMHALQSEKAKMGKRLPKT